MHGRKWQTGEATVLDVKAPPRNSEYGTILEVRIHPHDGGDAFWVDIPCPLGTEEFVPPHRGDLVNVSFSREENAARIDTDDPRVRRSSQERRRRAREEEIARYRGQTAWSDLAARHPAHPRATRHVSAPAASDDPLDLIAQLAELHRQGALTDAEFAAGKAKLLAAH